ncbi:MAG: hypothetical protein D6767_09005 [Candidatus Hydrogenedentota bacterium]|nr:MAG: hypothetical protein D6767_09005 [Candidatus Hydrogenedentota bacterium]
MVFKKVFFIKVLFFLFFYSYGIFSVELKNSHKQDWLQDLKSQAGSLRAGFFVDYSYMLEHAPSIPATATAHWWGFSGILDYAIQDGLWISGRLGYKRLITLYIEQYEQDVSTYVIPFDMTLFWEFDSLMFRDGRLLPGAGVGIYFYGSRTINSQQEPNSSFHSVYVNVTLRFLRRIADNWLMSVDFVPAWNLTPGQQKKYWITDLFSFLFQFYAGVFYEL